ncbi:uncharacterized protein LOC142334751 isoform X2 [Convolutriloba macropyga]|uniref:uncharacterized protein LOC142334751 isoform X2 n=1 Tax=Convolutriloba macropyga TaxID=536237 RepID=UPI003F520DB4
MKLLRSKALLITSVLLGVLCEVGFASSEGSDGDSSGGQPQQPPPRVSSDGQGAAGNNGTNPSGNREPHADSHGGGEHGKDKEEKKNYRNPFSYEPKGVVIVVIIVGAFVMMAIVLCVVIGMRSWACPRYKQWYDSHPNLRGYLPQFATLTSRMGRGGRRKKAEMGRGKSSHRRRHSATESHLELPKAYDRLLESFRYEQDSLDNMAEIDNESFLASLENVNFSLTPPSVRRNFGPPPPLHSSKNPNYPHIPHHHSQSSMTVSAPPPQQRYGVSGGSVKPPSSSNQTNRHVPSSGQLDSDRDSLYL